MLSLAHDHGVWMEWNRECGSGECLLLWQTYDLMSFIGRGVTFLCLVTWKKLLGQHITVEFKLQRYFSIMILVMTRISNPCKFSVSISELQDTVEFGISGILRARLHLTHCAFLFKVWVNNVSLAYYTQETLEALGTLWTCQRNNALFQKFLGNLLWQII